MSPYTIDSYWPVLVVSELLSRSAQAGKDGRSSEAQKFGDD